MEIVCAKPFRLNHFHKSFRANGLERKKRPDAHDLVENHSAGGLFYPDAPIPWVTAPWTTVPLRNILRSCDPERITPPDRNRARRAFAKTLREFRQATGLSQEKFAAAAEMDRTQISAIERAKHDPGLYTMVRLYDFLKVKPSRFWRVYERYHRDEPKT